MLNVSCNLLNSVLKVENTMADWVLLPNIMRIIPHMASTGRDQISEFEVQFLLNTYHICTIIKSKNGKFRDYLYNRLMCL